MNIKIKKTESFILSLISLIFFILLLFFVNFYYSRATLFDVLFITCFILISMFLTVKNKYDSIEINSKFIKTNNCFNYTKIIPMKSIKQAYFTKNGSIIIKNNTDQIVKIPSEYQGLVAPMIKIVSRQEIFKVKTFLFTIICSLILNFIFFVYLILSIYFCNIFFIISSFILFIINLYFSLKYIYNEIIFNNDEIKLKRLFHNTISINYNQVKNVLNLKNEYIFLLSNSEENCIKIKKNKCNLYQLQLLIKEKQLHNKTKNKEKKNE